MYRVKGSGLTGRGASWGVAAAAAAAGGPRGGSGGAGPRLRWWAAVIGLALAVLGLFTAVTLWLGFSVTAAAPPAPATEAGVGTTTTPGSARPRTRQASAEAAQEILGTQLGRVREASAIGRRRPSTTTAPPVPDPSPTPTSTKGTAEVVMDMDDGEATPVDDVRFARDPDAPTPLDATPTYEDEGEGDDEIILVPTGNEQDTSEQRFYIDDFADSTSTLPSAVASRHRLHTMEAPPSPLPIPQTPTLSFPRDAHVAATMRDPPPTPPTRFDLGTPPNHRAEGEPPARDLSDAGNHHQRIAEEKNRFSIRRGSTTSKESPVSGSLTLGDPHGSEIDSNQRLAQRVNVNSNMYSIRRNEPVLTGGRPIPRNEDPAQKLMDVRRMDSGVESGEELKHHLLEEIRSAHEREKLIASPSDKQLNEFLLREMAADSRTEDVVQREIPHVEGGNVLFGSLGRYPPQNEKVQYYIKETPTTSAPAAANSVTSFLQRRVQELHAWLTPADAAPTTHSTPAGAAAWMDAAAGGGGVGDGYADLRRVLVALNSSLSTGDAAPVLKHLRELYYKGGGGSGPGSVPQALRNSSSLMSVGLLAFDLLLLHNVQQIAWGEEPSEGRTMLQDPEVAALNSLFLDPSRMRTTDPMLAAVDADSAAEVAQVQEVSLLEELVEFVKSGARAMLTLGRAYRSGGDTLDCMWTLYCRNLDKTARMRGPYGFLARLNGLGLRLLMGEFPLETALDTILREMSHGWTSIDCANFFPKCSPEVATRVVLQTAMGAALEDGLKLRTKSEIPVLRTAAEAAIPDAATPSKSTPAKSTVA